MTTDQRIAFVSVDMTVDIDDIISEVRRYKKQLLFYGKNALHHFPIKLFSKQIVSLNYGDIIEYSIKPITITDTETQKTGSRLKRGAVGGVLLGPLGAVAGAASVSKVKTSTQRIVGYQLDIIKDENERISLTLDSETECEEIKHHIAQYKKAA